MSHVNVEQWGLFEVVLEGPSSGNPFLDIQLSAEFQCEDQKFMPAGFYDGEGCYRIRFMPNRVGDWTYTTQSNEPELDGKTGSFTCVEPVTNNHGPVHVHDRFHFAYADNTPYYSFGTTCYAWAHQGDELEEQTLATLKEASFNKMRMCVFPKHYPFNLNEPVYHPFERNETGASDFTRFDPVCFQHFEKRVAQLGELGIEADIIIWHPYDRWDYSLMDEEGDYRYLRYLIARLAAYRNVWWSLANEYDFLLKVKPMERWDRFFEILQEEDPYQHLRSIHNGDPDMNYDHTKTAVTHVCIQNWDVKRVLEWRKAYGKPIVNDELEYEGDIHQPWGSISAQEEVHRSWIMVIHGGYAGHGETYFDDPNDILWWAKGGVLHGESWQRLAFFRQIMEDGPGGLTPIVEVADNELLPSFSSWMWTRISGGMNGDYYLIYLGEHQTAKMPVWLPADDYSVDIIDTWAMTITPSTLQPYEDGIIRDPFLDRKPPTYYLDLPGKPYIAIRIQKKA